MKNVWNDDKDDLIGLMLKYILKWVILVSIGTMVVATVVKLFQFYNF